MRTPLLLTATAIALLAGCADEEILAPQAAAPLASVMAQAGGGAIDISGTWRYVESTLLVVRPEDAPLQLSCISPDGILTINQDGANFTGTLVHATSVCQTKEGYVVPAPWALPYEAVLSGRITGLGLHIDQYDAAPAPPIHCPKQGGITVVDGAAVGLRTTGRCDLSGAPFRPATATNSGLATRP
jgi:hypothetical protein